MDLHCTRASSCEDKLATYTMQKAAEILSRTVKESCGCCWPGVGGIGERSVKESCGSCCADLCLVGLLLFRLLLFLYYYFVYSTVLLVYAVVNHTLLKFMCNIMCYEIYHVP